MKHPCIEVSLVTHPSRSLALLASEIDYLGVFIDTCGSPSVDFDVVKHKDPWQRTVAALSMLACDTLAH